jgi:DNA-directed RNA polymerase specialized sigma24 family protein
MFAQTTQPMTKRMNQRPAVYAEMNDITRCRSTIEDVLKDRGVPDRDLPDLVQEVFIGAWRSMQASRFRPLPGVPIDTALERWLIGIAWRQASHYTERAWYRHEVPKRDPMVSCVVHSPSAFDQIDARRKLCTLDRLESKFRNVLSLAAQGWQVGEIAAELGNNPNTTTTRLRIARRRFVRSLARWRRTGNGREAMSEVEAELMHGCIASMKRSGKRT